MNVGTIMFLRLASVYVTVAVQIFGHTGMKSYKTTGNWLSYPGTSSFSLLYSFPILISTQRLMYG
jgi:hypothetical protein